MIQIAAPSVASAPSPASGPSAQRPANAPESGTFAQTLAQRDEGHDPAPKAPDRPTSTPDAASHEAPAPAAAAESEATTATARPAVAAPLPADGKILPALPGDPDTGADPATVGQVPPALEPKQPPAQAIPSLLAAVRAIRVGGDPEPGTKAVAPAKSGLSDESAAGGDSASDAKEPTVADPATPALLAAMVLPNPAGSVAAVARTAVATAQTTATPTTSTGRATAGPAPAVAQPLPQPAGAPALPPAIAAQMAGLPLSPAPQPTATAAPQGSTEHALAVKVDPAMAQAAAPAAISFDPAPAKPMAAVRLRPQVTGADHQAMLAPDPAATGTNPLALAPAANPAPAMAMPADVAISRPHDFAGLVDRLIAARDAAQTGLPQTVHMSINHADFGPISLNFSHDQAGLAVSVASADPDFARTVQAAIPAPGAATTDAGARDARQGSGQQGGPTAAFARADGSAAGDSGQRQSRGAPAFAGEGRGPAANRSGARDDAASRPRGIFA